jgi:hypothetical protein
VADLLELVRLVRGDWKAAVARWGVEASQFTERRRGAQEPFPWDFIDHGLSRDGLWEEYRRAVASEPSLPGPLWNRVAAERRARLAVETARTGDAAHPAARED